MVDLSYGNHQKARGHKRNGSSGSTNDHNHQEKDFQCWASLRAIFGMMIPSCCGSSNSASIANNTSKLLHMNMPLQGSSPTTSVVTCTIFGPRKGKVNFCVQEDPSSPPLLLLEFAIPTHTLVKEMQSGLLRITLECEKKNSITQEDSMALPSLFSEPVWSMYCNGRKVGFAMKKTAKSESDSAIANLMNVMQSVTTGAGVIPCRSYSNKHDACGLSDGANASKDSIKMGANKDSTADGHKDNVIGLNNTTKNGNVGINVPKLDQTSSANAIKLDNAGPYDGHMEEGLDVLSVGKPSMEEDELIYMRATYERVVGSVDSEAFHMINPDGSQCQELSVFLTRS